jgi:phosphatidylethanolamine/phosphatidyl-N-methylethanolamine N-methyltransferase
LGLRRSVTTSVESTYRRLAPVYDLLYGVGLQHGRRRAMARLAPRDGERILEVGVGTGLSLRYPRACRVAAVDLSAAMLERARTRVSRRILDHVGLCRMDAARLAFRDNQFDAVYAPYLINVVPDPAGVAREMLRVCRPGGRLVLLNHFATNEPDAWPIRIAGRVAALATSADWSLHLEDFLRVSGLTVVSVERVNLRVSSIVVCRK